MACQSPLIYLQQNAQSHIMSYRNEKRLDKTKSNIASTTTELLNYMHHILNNYTLSVYGLGDAHVQMGLFWYAGTMVAIYPS